MVSGSGQPVVDMDGVKTVYGRAGVELEKPFPVALRGCPPQVGGRRVGRLAVRHRFVQLSGPCGYLLLAVGQAGRATSAVHGEVASQGPYSKLDSHMVVRPLCVAESGRRVCIFVR